VNKLDTVITAVASFPGTMQKHTDRVFATGRSFSHDLETIFHCSAAMGNMGLLFCTEFGNQFFSCHFYSFFKTVSYIINPRNEKYQEERVKKREICLLKMAEKDNRNFSLKTKKAHPP
jgi:hypothetical protein